MDLVECLHEGLGAGVNQVALTGRGLARLADGFFGVLGKTSAGYVTRVPRTLANGVRV